MIRPPSTSGNWWRGHRADGRDAEHITGQRILNGAALGGPKLVQPKRS